MAPKLLAKWPEWKINTMRKTNKKWNVWIEGSSSIGYFEGRDMIESVCGSSGGSGSGTGGWDVSYHKLTLAQAKKIMTKAMTLDIIQSVKVYK